MKRFILAITGASGVCYGKRLFDCLKAAQAEIHVIISERGVELLNIELGLKPSYFKGKNVSLHNKTADTEARKKTEIIFLENFTFSNKLIMPDK